MTEYVEKLHGMIGKLHDRVFRAQVNVANLFKTMYSWAMIPVLERKNGTPENLLVMSEREEKFEERYRAIESSGAEINRALDENYKLYFDLEIESDKNEKAGENGECGVRVKHLLK